MNTINKQQLLFLLEKKNNGTCTVEEEELLNNWFEQVPIIEELTFVSEAEREEIRLEISGAITKRIEQPIRNTRRFRPWKTWLIGAASILILCISFSVVYFLSNNNGTKVVSITVPKGINKLPVTLPDSSLVWLAGGSSITFKEKFAEGSREVALSGSAYFSIRPDKNAPFTVTTPKAIFVRVLGTSFVVDGQENTNQINISVVTGVVQIDENKRKLSVLVPGEKLSYFYKDQTFSKENYPPAELDEWKDNSIIYLNNVSVRELSIVLQTIYRVQLVYDYKLTAQYRFNMSFSKYLTIDEVLDMLRTISGLQFEKKDNEIIVK